MKNYIICFLFWAFQSAQAQFTTAQKDSVLSVVLGYPTGNYELKISFYPAVYYPSEENFEKYSEKDLLAQMKKDPSDAELYRILFYIEKDFSKKEKYYIEAVNLYNEWLNQNADNVKAVEHAMSMCFSVNDYELLGRYTAFAVPRFPQSRKIISNAILYHLNYTRDFSQAELLLQKGLELFPNDLELLASKTLLYQSIFITDLNNNKKPQVPDIQFTYKVMNENPNKVEYKHLHHYNQCMMIYLKGMLNLFDAKEEPDNPFSVLNINQEEQKILKEILKFTEAEIKNNNKNKADLLSLSGFVNCMLNNLPKANENYEAYHSIVNTESSTGFLILVNYLQKKWNNCEKYLEQMITKKKSMPYSITDYGSLTELFNEHLKNHEKEKAIIERVRALPFENDIKNSILMVWYLKTKNIAQAKEMLPKTLGKYHDKYSFVFAVLNDQKEEAKKYLELLIVAEPEKKNLQRIKTQLGF